MKTLMYDQSTSVPKLMENLTKIIKNIKIMQIKEQLKTNNTLNIQSLNQANVRDICYKYMILDQRIKNK